MSPSPSPKCAIIVVSAAAAAAAAGCTHLRQKFVDLYISPLVSKANNGRVRVLLRSDEMYRFLNRLCPYLLEVAEWYSASMSNQDLPENQHVLNVQELALLLEHAGLVSIEKVRVCV